MLNYRTLTLYLSLSYFQYFLFTTLILACFLVLAGAFDVIQHYKTYTLSFSTFIQLVALKVPSLINDISPLISFISVLFFLKKLNRNNELVILMGNGLSFFKILLLPIIISIILGVFFISIISPFSTYSLQKLEKLENKIKRKKSSGFAVLTSNILFFEEHEDRNRIIQAQSLDFSTKKFYNTMILVLDSKNNLVERIDAPEIILEDKYFKVVNPKILTKHSQSNNSKNIVDVVQLQNNERSDSFIEKNNNIENFKSSGYVNEIRIPTNLSISNFSARYLPPQLIYIWNLPSIIRNFSKSGFPINDYKVYYYKQLSKPLYMVMMVLLASCFIKLNSMRNNTQARLISLALLTGIIVFAVLEITTKLLITNGIYPIWAILLPIFLISMLCNFVILHFY